MPQAPPFEIRTKDATKYLYIWFRVLGISMPTRFKVFYIIYSLIFNIYAVIIVPMSFTLSYFIRSEAFQINQFLTSFQVGVNVLGCAIKFIIIVRNRRYFAKMQTLLGKLDARISHPEEVHEARRVIRFGNFSVCVLAVLYCLYSTVTLAGAVYIGRPPYSLYMPYLNWRDSQWSFYIVCVIEYSMISVAILQDVAADSYALVYIRLLHSHLKMVIMKVGRIGTDPKCTQQDNRRELLHCINDHKSIIAFTNYISHIMSQTYFCQFLLTSLALGATLINISTASDSSQRMGSAVFVIALIVQSLPICYCINCFVDESDRLSEAIFHTNWIDQNFEFCQMCLVFMHRSQQTIVLYAGKMFPISLATFVSIIKFSFSLYTVVNRMDFGNRLNQQLEQVGDT